MRDLSHSCEKSFKIIAAGVAVCLVCGNVLLSTLPDYDDTFALEKVAPHGYERVQPIELFTILRTMESGVSGTVTPMRQPQQGTSGSLPV
ncbi:MAG TPA: hypothetical protein VJ327_01235 [Patescibacteria group bacterium]|nr:hypothetical protein [Patescibacteria group bacterium]